MKMTCSRVALSLVDLARGIEPAPHRMELLEAHLRECPDCERRLERERGMSASLRALAVRARRGGAGRRVGRTGRVRAGGPPRALVQNRRARMRTTAIVFAAMLVAASAHAGQRGRGANPIGPETRVALESKAIKGAP